MNTILFDLDGTLLPIDGDVFEKEYFRRIAMKLGKYFSPEDTVKYIWQATVEMVLNTDPTKTNKEIFMDKFSQLTSRDEEEMYPLFLDFYRSEYRELKNFITPSKYIIESIKLLKEKGYRMVVATNPIFPMEAILDRIRWAGLNELDFELITCFEKMHFCKPQIKYYEEILSIINVKPESCLMVGNDVEEDLAAGKLGIKTFLIEDNVLNRRNLDISADYSGSYKDFHKFIKGLPVLL